MPEEGIPHPAIVSADEWKTRRVEHLKNEKALTRQRDRVGAERRRLPMVKLEKEYVFEGPDGHRTLLELFEGQRQLVVYHFMFDPEWTEGCPGCTGFVDALGDLSMLPERKTRFVLVSRAPLEKLEAYKAKKGWDWPWYSSLGSDFNYDFHVTLDASRGFDEYNYRKLDGEHNGESHGLSVFFRLGKDVHHTYSTYARGAENLTNSYELLDVTPYGRQEDWEDSPEGWPQQPTYG